MNHLTWQETNGNAPGPVTHYGYWEGAKVFSIYWPMGSKSEPTKGYVLKSMLPGFNQNLPPQKDVAASKEFAERMLQRWVAKRGLLFKSHIVITDAMDEAAFKVLQQNEFKLTDREMIKAIIKAALEARG